MSMDLYADAVRAVRAEFSAFTGLRTYAANKWTTGGTFDADAPFNDTERADVDAWIAHAAAEVPEVEITYVVRKSRMTITLNERIPNAANATRK